MAGLSDGRGAECAAKEGDVLAFFDGGFDGVGSDGGDGKGTLGLALTRDWCPGCLRRWMPGTERAAGIERVGGADGGAEGGEVVEVGFEVFEVESEVEDVSVGVGADGAGSFGLGGDGESGECCAAAEEHRTPTGDDVVEFLCLLICHVIFP